MTKRAIARAFSRGEFDACMDYITEHTIWNTPGEQLLQGKKEIKPFCAHTSAYFQSVETQFRELNIIEDEHCVAINGTAEFKRDGLRLAFVSSCDVYQFDKDQRIVSIHSYCITERPEKNPE